MKFRKFAIDSSKFNLIDRVLNGSHTGGFSKGSHKKIPDMCVMEAASWVTNSESKTDHPECTAPELTSLCITMNDMLSDRVWESVDGQTKMKSDELRDKYLKPLIPVIINTRLVVHWVDETEKAQGYNPGDAINIPHSAATKRALMKASQLGMPEDMRYGGIGTLERVEALMTERTDAIREAAAAMKKDIADYRIAKGWSKPISTPLTTLAKNPEWDGFDGLEDAEACDFVIANSAEAKKLSADMVN